MAKHFFIFCGIQPSSCAIRFYAYVVCGQSFSYFMNFVSAENIPESLLHSIFDFPNYEIAEQNRASSIEKIIDAIDALPELQKKIILLRYYRMFSIKEISDQLSLSESYIRSRHNQAMHRLRKGGNEKYNKMRA
jgi:RNA polymerase sigma factor (sigma-70 family)